MTLPKETIDAIKSDASRLATGMWPDTSPYSLKRRAAAAALIELGATEWAGKAQPAIDALDKIAKYTHECGCVPCVGQCRTPEALQMEIEGLIEIASNALAKHKGGNQ